MALEDRTVDLILKAEIGQALKPLADMVQQVKAMTTAIKEQQEAARNGATTNTEYSKSVNGMKDASAELLKARIALDTFTKQTASVDVKQARVDAFRQARDELVAASPDVNQRTAAQQTAIDRRERALATAEKQAQSINAQYARTVDLLTQMGILSDKLAANQQRLAVDAAHAQITASVRDAGAVLGGAREFDIAGRIRDAKARADAEQEALRIAMAPTKSLVSEQARAADEAAAQVAAARETALRRALGPIKGIVAEQNAFATAQVEAEKENGKRIEAAIKESADAEEAARALALRRAIGPVSGIVAEQNAFAAAQIAAEKENGKRIEAAIKERADAEEAARALELRRAVGPVRGLLAEQEAFAAAQIAAEKENGKRIEAAIKESAEAEEAARALALRRAIGPVSGIVAEQEAFAAAQIAAEKENGKRIEAAIKERAEAEEAARALALRRAVSPARGLLAEQEAFVAAQVEAERENGKRIAKAIEEAAEAEAEARTLALRRAIGPARAIVAAQEQAERDRVERAAMEARRVEADASLERAAFARAAAARPLPVPPTATSQVGTLLSGLDRASIGAVTDVEAAVAKLEVTFSKAGLTAQSFNQAMDQSFAAQRRITQDTGLIDNFRALDAAIAKSIQTDRLAVAELQRVAAAYAAGTASISELRRAEAASGNAAQTLAAQVAQQRLLSEQLKARRIDTANLTAETAKLVAQTDRLATAQRGASAAGSHFLGLNAFQFQNLQFQVNDVITQLSLGQGILRTFEAQAGQIFQIFELTTTQMKNLVIYGVPAAAVIVTLVAAMLRVKETADITRGFSALLAGTADAATHSAEEMTKLVREAEKFGLSIKDATVALTEFHKAGFTGERSLQALKAIRDAEIGQGRKPEDTAKALASIPSLGMKELQDLAREYGVLGSKLNEYILKSYDAGKAGEAQIAVFNAIRDRAEEAAGFASPFTKALDEVKQAWNSLLDALGNTEDTLKFLEYIKTTIHELTMLLNVIERITKAIQSKDWKELGNVLGLIAGGKATSASDVDAGFKKLNAAQKLAMDLDKQLQDVERKIDGFGAAKSATDASFLKELTAQAEVLRKKLEDARYERDKLEAGGGTVTPLKEGASTATSTTTRPSSAEEIENFKKIVDGLMKRGDDLTTAMAFAGNAIVESGGRADAFNPAGGGQGSRGAFQWRGDRLKEFQARNEGKLPNETSLDAQLDFVKWEREHTHKYVEDALKQAKGLAAQSEIISRQYEAPGLTKAEQDKEAANRVTRTRELAQRTGRVDASGGALTGASPEEIDARNQDERRELIRKRDAIVEKLDKGNTDARKAADERKTLAYERELEEQARNIRKGSQESFDNEELRKQLVAEDRERRKRIRDDEEKEAKKTAQDQIDSLQQQINQRDKTNVRALNEAITAKYAKIYRDLDEAIRAGADPKQIAGIRSAEQAAEVRERLEAAADAGRAVVDALVKDRDAQVAKITEDGKRIGTSTTETFRLIAKVVAEFAPKIEAARQAASGAVGALPPSAKRSEQQAELAKIRPQDEKAFTDEDETRLRKIKEIVAARDSDVKRLTDDVRNYRKTQSEADAEIQQAYEKARPLIIERSDALQEEIELQRRRGQITVEAYERIRAEIERTKSAANDLTQAQLKFLNSLENIFSGSFGKAFDTVTESIGKGLSGIEKWKDVLKDAGQAFRQFVADVLKGVAQLLVQQAIKGIFSAAIGSLGGGSGGGGGGGGGDVGSIIVSLLKLGASAASGGAAPALHSGGIVGSDGAMRPVNPMMFLGAARAHRGALVGLSSNEVPTILQTGEEVLTRTDARHRLNGGRGAKSEATSMPSIRQVLLMDPSQVSAALAGSHGEKVVLTHIKNNSGAVRGLLNQR